MKREFLYLLLITLSLAWSQGLLAQNGTAGGGVNPVQKECKDNDGNVIPCKTQSAQAREDYLRGRGQWEAEPERDKAMANKFFKAVLDSVELTPKCMQQREEDKARRMSGYFGGSGTNACSNMQKKWSRASKDIIWRSVSEVDYEQFKNASYVDQMIWAKAHIDKQAQNLIRLTLAAELALQSLEEKFEGLSALWFSNITIYATNLLYSLAALALAYQLIMAIIKGVDLGELMGMLVPFIITVGFFAILINYAEEWSKDILVSFETLAEIANYNPNNSNQTPIPKKPSEMMVAGYKYADAVMNSQDKWYQWPPLYITSLIVLLIFAVISAFMLMVWAEFYVITAAGVILLGFGGTPWTSDIAKRYLMYILSTAIKLYCLLLIVGVGMSALDDVFNPNIQDSYTLLRVVAILFIIMILVVMLPGMIQGIVNGSTIGSGGPALTAMMMTATSAVASLAKNVIGVPGAVKGAAGLASQVVAGGGSKWQAAKAVGGAFSSGMGFTSGGGIQGAMKNQRIALMAEANEALKSVSKSGPTSL